MWRSLRTFDIRKDKELAEMWRTSRAIDNRKEKELAAYR